MAVFILLQWRTLNQEYIHLRVYQMTRIQHVVQISQSLQTWNFNLVRAWSLSWNNGQHPFFIAVMVHQYWFTCGLCVICLVGVLISCVFINNSGRMNLVRSWSLSWNNGQHPFFIAVMVHQYWFTCGLCVLCLVDVLVSWVLINNSGRMNCCFQDRKHYVRLNNAHSRRVTFHHRHALCTNPVFTLRVRCGDNDQLSKLK